MQVAAARAVHYAERTLHTFPNSTPAPTNKASRSVTPSGGIFAVSTDCGHASASDSTACARPGSAMCACGSCGTSVPHTIASE
eukprot:3872174-Pleurochrysis_carterae.AAC.2